MYVGDKWSSRVGKACAAEHHLCSQKILVLTKSCVGLTVCPPFPVSGCEMSHFLA